MKPWPTTSLQTVSILFDECKILQYSFLPVAAVPSPDHKNWLVMDTPFNLEGTKCYHEKSQAKKKRKRKSQAERELAITVYSE